MSNIYDSANALSRGLRELPEYKAVKTAKDAISADAEASNHRSCLNLSELVKNLAADK